jgi:hypothetical protein
VIAAATAMGLVVGGNIGYVIFLYEAGKPSVAQVTGMWTDGAYGGNATLRIFPDGTFTATGLPPDTSTSSAGTDVTVQALPAHEHGTWQLARGDGSWYVVCSLTGGPQFQFFLVGSASASFTYVQGQFDDPTIDSFENSPASPGCFLLRAAPHGHPEPARRHRR